MTQSTGAAPTPSSSQPGAAPALDATAVVRHLAHELRQPLSTIESITYYLGLILPHQDAKARRQMEKLQQAVQQASWILSDAVHYLQASPAMPQLIDVDELVSESVSETAGGERMSIALDLAERPTLVELDPEQGRHLVRNVLGVFRQLSKPDPYIAISTATDGADVTLRFETAWGERPAGDLESMFEPFHPHLPAGSGLALASVRRIVQAHGGRLDFQSGDEDRLVLTVVLPAAG